MAFFKPPSYVLPFSDNHLGVHSQPGASSSPPGFCCTSTFDVFSDHSIVIPVNFTSPHVAQSSTTTLSNLGPLHPQVPCGVCSCCRAAILEPDLNLGLGPGPLLDSDPNVLVRTRPLLHLPCSLPPASVPTLLPRESRHGSHFIISG
jgi:hypothetical protein